MAATTQRLFPRKGEGISWSEFWSKELLTCAWQALVCVEITCTHKARGCSWVSCPGSVAVKTSGVFFAGIAPFTAWSAGAFGQGQGKVTARRERSHTGVGAVSKPPWAMRSRSHASSRCHHHHRFWARDSAVPQAGKPGTLWACCKLKQSD